MTTTTSNPPPDLSLVIRLYNKVDNRGPLLTKIDQTLTSPRLWYEVMMRPDFESCHQSAHLIWWYKNFSQASTPFYGRIGGA